MSRLLLSLVRTLARGAPVPPAEVCRRSAELDMPRDLLEPFLRQRAERDGAGNLVGLMGLSLNRHPHRFAVGGRGLSTWCAWDTLFLLPLLGQPAEVASVCPATG